VSAPENNKRQTVSGCFGDEKKAVFSVNITNINGSGYVATVYKRETETGRVGIIGAIRLAFVSSVWQEFLSRGVAMGADASSDPQHRRAGSQSGPALFLSLRNSQRVSQHRGGCLGYNHAARRTEP